MNKKNKVLVLAPHTDDGELGCGGTLSRLIREGSKVWYIAFSTCAESLPEGMPANTLVNELKNATNIIGIKEENVLIRKYQVRHLSEHRQEILDDLVNLNKSIDPDIVFMPSIHDIHQDHCTISTEGQRAFKKKTIFAYELPWNNYTFCNQAFFALSEDDVMIKINALKQYKSQYSRDYMQSENILSILKTHGIQIGVKYAEVFEVPRLVNHIII